MADANYSWPARSQAAVIGKRHNRLDGPVKATGGAKYACDIQMEGMLIAKGLGCPHAHCRIRSIDVAPALSVPGVVAAEVLPHAEPGSEINWEGELLAVVAAESDGAATEGLAKIRVDYELLDVFTAEQDLEAAQKAGRANDAGSKSATENEPGEEDDEDEFVDREMERLLSEAAYTVEGFYGIDTITHCCLEPHGATVRWDDGKLLAYLSTQNVSGTDEGFATALNITSDDVEVRCEYIGGGFGSKFAPDYWGIAAAQLAKKTGRPVQLVLDRDQELKIAGCRPSGYIKVRLGADREGRVTVWDSHHWGSSGHGARGGTISHGVVPYVFEPKNHRCTSTGIRTNTAPVRAWRAPNHPQACAMSQTAYDDLAAKMGMDSYEVFRRNLSSVSNDMADVYAEEMGIAAKLIDWKAKWHAHGKGPVRGSVVEGLGMALHTWGGTANTSNLLLKIHPDGAVESFCGTQDLGTGTRTVCAIVLAETLGLDPKEIRIHIGSSKYPFSGASGGSTTVGAVSESHRRAGQDALAKMFPLIAKKLDVDAATLEAVGGRIQVRGEPSRGLSWKESCRLLGLEPLEISTGYERGTKSPLSNSGVGGVQMAEVAVDRDTGVVRMKKFVAVQDMGLVINRKTAESQIYGAVTMGIAYALFEQRITDPSTGRFLNAGLADYKLPRLGDIGEIVVEIYEPDDQRERGVIGLGEPPVISPGAAISNAVANALGVRVPVLPLTPQRVLEALTNSGKV
jgi:xanthine dehydrogenase YagR molybdenum-binding subunit